MLISSQRNKTQKKALYTYFFVETKDGEAKIIWHIDDEMSIEDCQELHNDLIHALEYIEK